MRLVGSGGSSQKSAPCPAQLELRSPVETHFMCRRKVHHTLGLAMDFPKWPQDTRSGPESWAFRVKIGWYLELVDESFGGLCLILQRCRWTPLRRLGVIGRIEGGRRLPRVWRR